MHHTTLVLHFYTVTLFELISDLDLWLAWASYLYGTTVVPSEALWKSVGLQLRLVSAADKVKRVRFDFWPDPDLTLDLLKKILTLFRVHSLRAFERRLAPTFSLKVWRRGDKYAPPPSPRAWKIAWNLMGSSLAPLNQNMLDNLISTIKLAFSLSSSTKTFTWRLMEN